MKILKLDTWELKTMEGKLVAIIGTVLVIVAMVQVFTFYNTVLYQADIAGGYILGVKSTNNINDMKSYLQAGLDQLNRYNYRGSPVLFPTSYTNFDYLKADIQKQINGLNEYQRTYTNSSDKSYAYQQTINNAKSNADTLNNRQSTINENWGTNPYQNPVGYALIFIGLVVIIPIHLVTQYWENREYRKKYERPLRV